MRKDCVSRELTREIVVGAFMVMILLGLSYFTIILSKESLFAKKSSLEVVFADVMGLRESDPVVVRGMPVGTVQSLHLADDGVHVVASLDKPVVIWKDYRITVETTSMLGGRHMVIETGSPLSGKPSKQDLLRGVLPHDIIADTAALINAVKKGLIEDGMIDNLRIASADLRSVAARINSGEGILGRLMSPDDSLYNDLADAVVSLKSVADRLDRGEGTLGKLMSGDGAMYDDLKVSAANLRELTGRIAEGKGSVGRLMSGDDRLYEDLAAIASSLRTVTAKLEKGEGLVGKLLTDETLYTEIESMVIEMRATIDDFRETAPVTTFSSIFFGAF